MYRNKRILAIIPARGGSKGLPGKNIKLLHGKPLIAWTIEEALKSRYLDEVVVSTENKKIAAISRKYGAEVPFSRPKRLATSLARMIDVLLHTMKFFKNNNEHYDLVILLQATSPLRGYEDIDASIELLVKKKARAVISVCESEQHPWWSIMLTRNGRIKDFNKNGIMNKNRQELPSYYRINGALYIAHIEYIKREKRFIGKTTYAYVMPRERSVDIDTEFDFKLAEFLMTSVKKNKNV